MLSSHDSCFSLFNKGAPCEINLILNAAILNGESQTKNPFHTDMFATHTYTNWGGGGGGSDYDLKNLSIQRLEILLAARGTL